MNASAYEANQSRPTQDKMTVEQARKVRWLKSNPKTLGELIDEGFLDEHRLAWAAENAYNSTLKQAAQILLDWQKLSTPEPTTKEPATALPPEATNAAFPVGITLEQARVTRWPFSPYKDQSMGTLVETRQLSLKDLGFAIETAWDEHVRQAAMALMLLRLNQAVEEPESSAGLLKVVSGGRSFSERRQLQFALLEGFIFGILTSVWIGLLIWIVQRISNASSTSPTPPLSTLFTTPAGLIALVILIVLLGITVGGLYAFQLIFDRVFDWLNKQIVNHRKGEVGEERVVAAMHQALDGNWHLFRNVELPGHNKGDLDSVLVGPSGVWVLEIKTFTGEYRNIGEHWEYLNGNRWKLVKKSPSRQAQNNAVRLSNFLKADSIQQWINPAVIWANPDSPLSIENPLTAVWSLDRLSDELGNIWRDESVSETTRNQIVEKLTKLVEDQKKARQ